MSAMDMSRSVCSPCIAALVLAAPCVTAPAGAVAAERFEPFSADFAQAAAEPLAGAADAGEQWWVQPSLAIWLAGISGNVGVRDITAHLDLSFSDILQDSDSLIGLAGSVQFGKGKLGGYVNGFWMKIGQETPTPLGTADLTIEQSIMDFGVSYEVGRWPMEWTRTADKPARELAVHAYVGGRYNSLDLDAQFPVIPSRGRNKEWVDPMIGAWVDFPFAQDWSIVARGDIGGFGAASEFAWTAAVLGSWDFRLGRFPSSLQFGYLAIGDDYESGSGTDRFLWDTVMHGPLLNWLIRF